MTRRLRIVGGEALRDTDPGMIADCQRDPELIKAFLRENTELMDENRDLRARLEELEEKCRCGNFT